MSNQPAPSAITPATALAFGIVLLGLGFTVGRGFHTAQQPAPTATPASGKPPAPIAKALRLSPDGRTLAFTGVYNRSRRAARFLLDVESGQWRAVDSPDGWQDYIMGWNSDGSSLLFDREKIPRSVAETAPGLHRETVRGLEREAEQPAFARSALPRGEKSVSGFFAPGGEVIVKTRREPKSLFSITNGGARKLDAAPNFGQNRVVRENNREVLYVVRELEGGDSALFRVTDGAARQLTPPLADVTWSYVAESGGWLVVCRDVADNSGDWNWTLYRIETSRAVPTGTRRVPGDAIGVFWSPDRKTILGAGGRKLWRIEIPSLRSTQLGARNDWNADDAAWLNSREVVVAAQGSLWRVQLPSGTAREMWKFPAQYWQAD